jgi:hydrogenase nickel incorporation protein HypA/HybF
MHEWSLIAALMRKLQAIAREQQPNKIVGVRIRLGALSHLAPALVREHFAQVARGTAVEGVRVDIEVSAEITDAHAQDILLESVEVET